MFLTKDQGEAIGKVVRLILNPGLEKAVMRWADLENSRFERGGSGRPISYQLVRVNLGILRTLASEQPIATGPLISLPARGFHVWAMSKNADKSNASIRIGSKDNPALTLMDNRGFNFDPTKIEKWYIENIVTANEWIELLFYGLE